MQRGEETMRLWKYAIQWRGTSHYSDKEWKTETYFPFEWAMKFDLFLSKLAPQGMIEYRGVKFK
jgi:hypothetical protein